MQLEKYSDDLVRYSNLYHRLSINISLLECDLISAAREMQAMEAELEGEAINTESCDNYYILNGDIDQQIQSLKFIRDDAAEHLQNLLEIESSYQLRFDNKEYPFIYGYPEWLTTEIFPYNQKDEIMAAILADDGVLITLVNYDDMELHKIAINKNIDKSFFQVWWPVAGGVLSPGYLEQVSENKWLARGTER